MAGRPIRACFVTERFPPQSGGVSVAALRLARGLRAAGIDLHVVHPVPSPGAAISVEHADHEGVPVHRLHHEAWSSDAAIALLRLLRELDLAHDFDLFHAFFLTVVGPCARVMDAPPARPGRPLIASIRGSDALNKITFPYWRESILAGLRRATWITSVNRYYLDHIGRALDLDIAGRSSVIRNGVAPVAPADRCRIEEGNEGVAGTVGRFRLVKDIPLLVRAFAAVPAARRRRLLLAGDFDADAVEEARWTATLAEELGVRDAVRITGDFPHAEVGRHLRAMRAYVQSSAYEGLPNALLEAAAHGVPLIATAVGGMRELLTDGETGLLVPHGEPAALAGAMSRVLGDRDLAARLSAGALAVAAAHTEDHERTAWVDLYRRLTGPA